MASEGYEKVIRRYGTVVLQYGQFSGVKTLQDLIGRLHRVNPERVIDGSGALEVISLFSSLSPEREISLLKKQSTDRTLLDANCYGHHLIGGSARSI